MSFVRNRLDVRGASSGVQTRDFHAGELAVDFHLRRAPDDEEQIGNAFARR